MFKNIYKIFTEDFHSSLIILLFIFQTAHFFLGTFLIRLCGILLSLYFHGELSPAAPATWSAASGPASVPAPGRGSLRRSWLASSRVVATPPSTLLTSRVVLSAHVRRQLAGSHRGGGTGFGVGGGGGAALAAFPAGGGVISPGSPTPISLSW